MTESLPVLYSFRRCPYAMRARLGLAYANIRCELREVTLTRKPAQMLALSSKATVPILSLPDGRVIDESYDIVKWAISRNDPDGWQDFIPRTDRLVTENDGPFKRTLDHYKYAARFPGQSQEISRDQARPFLARLDRMLANSRYLLGSRQTVADIAILPFIRQFAHVNKAAFEAMSYPGLSRWLHRQLESDSFGNIMEKYPEWHSGDRAIYFPDLCQGVHSSLGASSE